MADLTTGTIKIGTDVTEANYQRVQVGEAVGGGDPLYLKSSDQKYWQAQADDSAEAEATGIALFAADADGYTIMLTGGSIDLGTTLVVGTTYVVSATKGAIAPITDLATGNYSTILGTATTAALLKMNIAASGVALP